MKLIEVFTKPKGKIKWIKQTPMVWRGSFEVGERKFLFTAAMGGADESTIYPLKLSREEIADIWIVGFMQTEPKPSHDITAGGKPIEVMNKSLVAFKEFAKKAKPQYVTFSAKESSRMKLYNIMVKKLARGLGFKILTAQQGTYVLQSKRIK